jgi:hypothetical protein
MFAQNSKTVLVSGYKIEQIMKATAMSTCTQLVKGVVVHTNQPDSESSLMRTCMPIFLLIQNHLNHPRLVKFFPKKKKSMYSVLGVRIVGINRDSKDRWALLSPIGS